MRRLNALAATLVPDRTFYLRLDAAERERRALERGEPDRLEAAGREFTARVEAAFDALAAREPQRIRVLDATLPPDELVRKVLTCLAARPEQRETD